MLTVNPGLIAGNRFSTVRSMVTALDRCSDLLVLPIDGYDFKKQKARAYKRLPGGRFEFFKSITPAADLWIVYTDGYYLDIRELGFRTALDYIQSQLAFHQHFAAGGTVGRLINPVEGEANTLKKSFAKLNNQTFRTIKTFLATTDGDVYDLLQQHHVIIAKPDWSGGGSGVEKLTSEKEVADFLSRNSLSEFCFQPMVTGDEKRFWFCGDKCVGARRIKSRQAPWMDARPAKYKSQRYDTSYGVEYRRDLEFACRMWAHTKLRIGSVDFIGDYINEVNGCGTTFIDYDGWTKIVDLRQELTDYVVSLVDSAR